MKIGFANIARQDGTLEAVKAAKQEIMAELQRRKAEEDARRAKIESIPGLKEIRKAKADSSAWRDEWNKSFEGEYAIGGHGVRPRPKYDFKAMYEKYPVAAAYLRLEAETLRYNDEIVSAAQDALDYLMEDPQANYKEALERYEASKREFAERHLWD